MHAHLPMAAVKRRLEKAVAVSVGEVLRDALTVIAYGPRTTR